MLLPTGWAGFAHEEGPRERRGEKGRKKKEEERKRETRKVKDNKKGQGKRKGEGARQPVPPPLGRGPGAEPLAARFPPAASRAPFHCVKKASREAAGGRLCAKKIAGVL